MDGGRYNVDDVAVVKAISDGKEAMKEFVNCKPGQLVYNIDIIIMTFKTNFQTYGGANVKWFEDNYFPIGIYYSETQICATDNECIKNSMKVDDFKEYKTGNRIWFSKNKKR